jgi:hypothetical protein
MKFSSIRSVTAQFGIFEFVAIAALVTSMRGTYWASLFLLSLLATRAVMPKSTSILYWPVGLAGVLLATYVGSWVQWFRGGGGVDVYFAQTLFFAQIVFFYLLGHIRATKSDDKGPRDELMKTWQQIVVSLPSLSLVVYASSQFVNKPFVMMGAYFGGGDHMNHAGMVYGLTGWTAGSGAKSPLDVYAVPDGIHFLIANLVGLDSLRNALTPITQVIVAAAWFEWLQAAAFVQLAIVVVVGAYRDQWFFRFSIATVAVVLATTVDRLVLQLMWAGFTTSLGMSWLLLIPLAVIRDVRQTLSKAFIATALIGLAYLAWIVYQPYAIPIGLLLVALTTAHLLSRFFKKGFFNKATILPIISVIFFGVAVFAGVTIIGTQNEFVERLSMSGATYEPYFYTVLLWCSLALLASAVLLLQKTSLISRSMVSFEATYVLAVLLMTGTAIGLVMVTSNFGLLDQPYYTQKMLWTLLFLCIPIVVASALSLLTPQLAKWTSKNRNAFMFCSVLVLVLWPITNGKYPGVVSQHTMHSWIGTSLAEPTGLDPLGEVAFSANDPQGTYIANLALQTTSANELDTTLSLSDNPFLVCFYISNRPITTVFTRTGGKHFLTESGCPSNLLYIESGERMDAVNPTYPQMTPGEEMSAISKPVIDEYLSTGFRGTEGFIRWATGLNSKILISSSSDKPSKQIKVGYIMSDAATRPHRITFRINGEAVLEQSFQAEEVGVVNLAIPTSEQDKNVDIEIDCDWREEEIWNNDLLVTPPRCLGVTSLELLTK